MVALSKGVVAAVTAIRPNDSSANLRVWRSFRLPWPGAKVSGPCVVNCHGFWASFCSYVAQCRGSGASIYSKFTFIFQSHLSGSIYVFRFSISVIAKFYARVYLVWTLLGIIFFLRSLYYSLVKLY